MSEYVFNAVSNAPEHTSDAEGRSLTVTLLRTLANLDALPNRGNRPLKLPTNPWDLVISRSVAGTDVSLGEHAHSLYESHETYPLAVFFDALNSHAPATHALDEAAIDAILRIQPTAALPGQDEIFAAICDAGFDAMQCVVTGGTLISLDREPWRFAHAYFECDGAPVTLEHASQPHHASEHAAADRVVARQHISRQNFMAYRNRAFPCLDWGEDVSAQIEAFPAEYLSLAFSRLATLDDLVRTWRANGTDRPDPRNLVFKSESDLTMQNYGDLRRYRSASGDMKTYETHIWIDRGNRLHFDIDPETRSIEIGYVGPHLRTWKF